MKYTSKLIRAIVEATTAIGIFGSVATAAITVTDFRISSSTVSFNIIGTISGPTPSAGANSLFFVNAIPSSPGFVLATYYGAPNQLTWTGSQNLIIGFPIFTGDPAFGDYFGMSFTSNLSVGDTVNGSVLAIYDSGTFDPSAVSSIDLIWGFGANSFSDGSSQSRFTVIPEPSSSLLACLCGFAMLTRRIRPQQ